MSHTIYLSAGSNLGDRSANLQRAISLISPKVRTVAQSSVYETEPWGYSDQPLFINIAIKGETGLDPHALLSFLKEIETSMGRQESFRYGPRLIDLDILFFDDLVINTPDLTIPHPRISERGFVLVPLAEIAPDLIHPALGKTIQQMKSGVDTSSVKLYSSTWS